MKKVLLITLLVTLLLAACGPTMNPSEVPRVSAEDLNKRLDEGEDILVIDARNSSRLFEQSHIPGAIRRPRSFDDVAHEQEIIAYCASEGEGDSASLASTLYAQGFTNVSVLDGGLSAWAEADYSVQGSGAAD